MICRNILAGLVWLFATFIDLFLAPSLRLGFGSTAFGALGMIVSI